MPHARGRRPGTKHCEKSHLGQRTWRDRLLSVLWVEAWAVYELFRQTGVTVGAALVNRQFAREYSRLAVSYGPSLPRIAASSSARSTPHRGSLRHHARSPSEVNDMSWPE